MPIHVKDVMEVLSILCDEKGLSVTLKQTAKGTAIAATCTALGGLAAGPAGLAVGGAVGGGLAAYCTWGSYEPVSKVILNMDKQQQQKLFDTVNTILSKLKLEDLVMLQAAVAGNMLLKDQLLNRVVEYFKNDLHMQFKD